MVEEFFDSIDFDVALDWCLDADGGLESPVEPKLVFAEQEALASPVRGSQQANGNTKQRIEGGNTEQRIEGGNTEQRIEDGNTEQLIVCSSVSEAAL